ncbi:TonB family protein [Puniceicoccaceae bacterium K14]|nr:TonB family protein [Puniceicoccaceae bacterium K14]
MNTINNTPRTYQVDVTKQNRSLSFSLSVFATALIFAGVPYFHYINKPVITRPTTHPGNTTIAPPKPLDLPEPPKPVDQKTEDPKLETPPIDVPIFDLDYLNLKPGTGPKVNYNDLKEVPQSITGIVAHLLKNLDRKPKALVTISPVYPYSMKRIDGKVIIEFIIQANGRPTQAKVVSTSHREFNISALEAVMKSKWQPGQIDGVDVATIVQLPVIFNGQ